ncbi:MAG TPA: cysteine desulfurase [Vicinamibacterales bacterium]|nr:cysteine desulfurase [Vicinamibacterales bacterium]
MTSDRREFLATTAAAGWFAARAAMAGTAQTTTPERWPSAFPALTQRVNGHPLTFLDSAATTLRPQSVIDALVDFYSTDNANPSRVHTLASRAGDRLAAARQQVARFVNAADPAEIIFVRGTSEGINLVAGTWGAANLKPGDEIVLGIAEHASNLMPWTRAARQAGATVRILDVDNDGRLRLDQLKQLLSARTRLVAFSHVSNVLGYINPAKEICAIARNAGAAVVIDGAQGAPHAKIDVRDLGCDFYVFSGHKMLGPMGTGVVWGRRELLDAMPPYHVGSNMAHAVDFEHAELEHGAQKYQAGTPDVAGPVGLAAAVRFFEQAGRRLQDHDDVLVRHGLARLNAIPKLRLIGPRQPDNRVPVFTFVIEGRAAADVAKAMDAQGIAVRAGDMAALPLLKRFGVTEAVRASAYVYSTPADLDRLADALLTL